MVIMFVSEAVKVYESAISAADTDTRCKPLNFQKKKQFGFYVLST